MIRMILLILTTVSLFIGCSQKIDEATVNKAIESEVITPVAAKKQISRNGKSNVIADTIINLTSFDRKYDSYIEDDSYLILEITAEESPQDEFDLYYTYEADTIYGLVESMDLLSAKLIVFDIDVPMFEVEYTTTETLATVYEDYENLIKIN